MKSFKVMIMISMAALAMAGCSNDKKENADEKFTYIVDEFADLQILRYQIPDWDSLSFNNKAFLYYTSEAAKCGRDIMFDQMGKYNLQIRKMLEKIIECKKIEQKGEEWEKFLVYAKRVFFSNGIYHHYAEEKFIPECSFDYFKSLMEKSGQGELCKELLGVIFDPNILPFRRCNDTRLDLVSNSAVNFYEGNLTDALVNDFYEKMEDPKDPHPISYGLNSKLVMKEDGTIEEQVWKVGGLYSKSIEKIIENLEKAKEFAETEGQKKTIELLVKYYTTGDLRDWDAYNIQWVNDGAKVVDFTNGFIEDYDDPLGRKATWEGIANFKDLAASRRTEAISSEAQWFEDNSPVDKRFKKENVKGVSAKVINVTALGGACYPSTPIGINLPNANWIRKEYGSKSVTINNITEAYDKAADEMPKSILTEFAWDQDEIDMCKKYGVITDNLHTDLHECLGHASGQLLKGVKENALKEFNSALEEARADLFALYYLADPKLFEMGLVPDKDAYKAEYMSYIRNGLFTQFTRIELGKKNTEAHMQDRKLIAEWVFEKGAKDNVIEKRTRDGKTYFVINDFEKLRSLFGELLKEIQRIKSEGDYKAGKKLIETYAVDIDPTLHKEVLERYAALNLKPYKGFINPDIVPVVEKGKVVDYKVVYNNDYLKQMLEYGKKYSFE
ncbi:MAG: dihydrofolate reductase [Bacteroidales bacterium]|nr:dihydrofolate reductase [Bacteroidales bacterium]